MLYDGQEKHALAAFDTKEQALAYINKTETAATALYPTLSADVGMLTHAPLWGNTPTSQSLRAVSYYLGISAGWPMREITLECENEKMFSLPLFHDPMGKIPQKCKISKQLFENITVFNATIKHEAMLLNAPFAFALIESEKVEAVDLSLAGGLRSADTNILGLPICFASLVGDTFKLRVFQSGRGAVLADDVMHMLALACFYRIGRADAERSYFAADGEYRVEGGAVVSLRSLCAVDVPI